MYHCYLIKNIKLLAEAKNKKVSEINACVLKRPRHDEIVKTLNKLDVKINFITDGDIAGALSVIGENPKNDIYYSTGGAPEGVVVAAALSCYGGQIQGRLVLDAEEKVRAKKLGITDFEKKYNIREKIDYSYEFSAPRFLSLAGILDRLGIFSLNPPDPKQEEETIVKKIRSFICVKIDGIRLNDNMKL